MIQALNPIKRTQNLNNYNQLEILAQMIRDPMIDHWVFSNLIQKIYWIRYILLIQTKNINFKVTQWRSFSQLRRKMRIDK